jgi:hypothetical protein
MLPVAPNAAAPGSSTDQPACVLLKGLTGVRDSHAEFEPASAWLSYTPQVKKRAQVTAFPPNYIHSIDSAHMMMTATACREAGLCFAGVHDSFWTHAGDVETMNAILREQFIKLHSRQARPSILAG